MVGGVDDHEQELFAVDSRGNRYTTASGAVEGEWHYTAQQLTPELVAELSAAGDLPLTQVLPDQEE